MAAEIKSIKVNLFWCLIAYCPVCRQRFDIADKDDDGYVARNIFNNSWGNLKGYEITCPFCTSELKIKEVEY